jgi:hypothetical protein
MTTFVFSAQGKKINPAGALDASFYAGTPNDQLTYTGNDTIVWDRINAERLRRGLPGLAEIGFPRPPDDTGQPEGTTGDTFTVKGPPGLTEAQAFAIFEQQRKAGSLVGLKPGDTINSASQALGGLPGAASLVPSLGSIPGALGQIATGIGNAAAGIASGAASLAKKTLTGITQAANSLVPTNPIGVADFAKQTPALVPIDKLSTTDVTAAMSQASRLVGQSADSLSDDKGLGKFGLDVQQLERAGVCKPGTASYLAQGQNSLTSVLSSPAVWTGKNGVTDLDSLLASAPKQDLIQQELMSSGISELKTLGVPTDALSASSLAGTSLNAAKSIGGTLDWASGNPLPPDIKNQFNVSARDGAFAVDFAKTKLNPAMLQEIPGIPAADTVDRQTVNAATERVVGNEKIPPVRYNVGPQPESIAEFRRRYQAAVRTIDQITQQIPQFNARAQEALAQGQVGEAYEAQLNLGRLASQLTEIDSVLLDRKRGVEALDPSDPGLVAEIQALKDTIPAFIETIDILISKILERIAALTR